MVLHSNIKQFFFFLTVTMATSIRACFFYKVSYPVVLFNRNVEFVFFCMIKISSVYSTSEVDQPVNALLQTVVMVVGKIYYQ